MIFTEGEEMNKCRSERRSESETKVERDEGRTTGVLTGQKVCLLHLLSLLSICVLNLLIKEYTSKNALCLCVP